MCIFNNINCVEYILFRMCVFILKHLCFFFMVRIKLCPYRSPGSPLRTSVEVSVREETVVVMGLKRRRPF